MRFSELIERVRERGVVVGELRAGSGGPDPEIRGVCEDSRKVRAGDLFVARSGSKKSGSEFIEEALAKGAVAVVCENDQWPGVSGQLKDSAGVAVENVNLACALLAHEVAGNPTAGMKIIGITGTKGKTTVAYLMRSVLKAAGHKVGMIGTVEIDNGVKAVPADMTTPGSVELVELFCRMRENGVTHCVMEVSSHALHQHRVAGIDFAVGIFTNLTGDHLDYHGTMEEYAAAKAMLFEGLKEDGMAVLNADDAWFRHMLEQCSCGVMTYGLYDNHGLSFAIKSMSSQSMHLVMTGIELISIQCIDLDFTTPLVGRHNAYNLAAVVAAVHCLGMADQELKRGLVALNMAQGAPGRLQAVTPRGVEREMLSFQVFVDYAHTHDALENVLTALRATMGMGSKESSAGDMLSGHSSRRSESDDPARAAEHGTRAPRGGTLNRLICVFGCGGDRDRTKRPKMGAVAERLADVVIVTSDNPRTENPAAIIDEICAGFSPGWGEAGKVTVEPDRRAAIRAAIAMARPGDVVLLAGKGHENYQIIGTTKHHFDDVEEAEAALRELHFQHQDTKTPRAPS